MTQVGCYSLHLYCDGVDCPNLHDMPLELAGGSAGDCRDQARDKGWKLQGTRRDVDLCPTCVERGEEALPE